MLRHIATIVSFAIPLGFLAGCQTTPPNVKADISKGVPGDYREQVALYFRKSLKDPYSVRDAEISGPTTAFAGILYGGTVPAVCVRLNAKNAYGAYMGITTYAIGFKDGKVSGAVQVVFDTCRKEQYEPYHELMTG